MEVHTSYGLIWSSFPKITKQEWYGYLPTSKRSSLCTLCIRTSGNTHCAYDEYQWFQPNMFYTTSILQAKCDWRFQLHLWLAVVWGKPPFRLIINAPTCFVTIWSPLFQDELEGTLRGHIGLIEEALDRLEGKATEVDRGKKMWVGNKSSKVPKVQQRLKKGREERK